MDAKEKLDRFSIAVIFVAVSASEAAATGEDRVGGGAFIGLLSCERLSLIRSVLFQNSFAIE